MLTTSREESKTAHNKQGILKGYSLIDMCEARVTIKLRSNKEEWLAAATKQQSKRYQYNLQAKLPTPISEQERIHSCLVIFFMVIK